MWFSFHRLQDCSSSSCFCCLPSLQLLLKFVLLSKISSTSSSNFSFQFYFSNHILTSKSSNYPTVLFPQHTVLNQQMLYLKLSENTNKNLFQTFFLSFNSHTWFTMCSFYMSMRSVHMSDPAHPGRRKSVPHANRQESITF